MSNEQKTQSSMCVTIDFEQLTFGELRKFIDLTAEFEDDEFVYVACGDHGEPSGFTAYVDASSL